MQAKIDAEIKKIVDDAYERCTTLLSQNMDKLKLVAEELLEKETIEAAEFNDIVNAEANLTSLSVPNDVTEN